VKISSPPVVPPSLIFSFRGTPSSICLYAGSSVRPSGPQARRHAGTQGVPLFGEGPPTAADNAAARKDHTAQEGKQTAEEKETTKFRIYIDGKARGLVIRCKRKPFFVAGYAKKPGFQCRFSLQYSFA
jgi:hypothetical protein